MKFDGDGPVIILAAHLGDAVRGCSRALMTIGDVRVVNVFAGAPPDVGRNELEGAIREDVNSLIELGRTATYLGFLRDTYRKNLGDPDPGVDQLLAELDGVVETASLVLAPLAAGSKPSPDRVLVRQMAVEILYGWAGSDPIDAALYADLPGAVSDRGAWPVELVGAYADDAPGILKAGPDSPKWARRLPAVVPEIDALFEPTRWLLDDAERDRKAHAMAVFGGSDFEPELYGIEVVVPLAVR